MARHSHFHNIQKQKNALDAVRGKVFTVHAKMIAVAARNGGDPSMNPTLRSAIDRAKADNVPNANIERAIKKGTGEDKEGTVYEMLTYEVLGPEGSVFMADAVTDNKNRTLLMLRTALSKLGGNLGSAGSVGWKFDKKAYLKVATGGKSGDEVELALIDAGADDLEPGEEGFYDVYAAPDRLAEVRGNLEAAGFKVAKDELIWMPKEWMQVSDAELSRKIEAIWEALEENDDITQVFTNAEIE